jgi:hypothetical protein
MIQTRGGHPQSINTALYLYPGADDAAVSGVRRLKSNPSGVFNDHHHQSLPWMLNAVAHRQGYRLMDGTDSSGSIAAVDDIASCGYCLEYQ